MARVKVDSPSNSSTVKMRAPLSPEAEENQMITLAMDLVKQRLIQGTASSQETTHFLKLASERDKRKLEVERLRHENELLTAKTENLQSMKKVEELYSDAIKAMRNYSGHGEPDEY